MNYFCINCGGERKGNNRQYCSKPFCRLAYKKVLRKKKTEWQRKKRQQELKERANQVKALFVGKPSKPPKLSWYEQVVYNNARREGKDPEQAVRTVRRIQDNKTEFSTVEISQAISAYLRGRRRRGRSVWSRTMKNGS